MPTPQQVLAATLQRVRDRATGEVVRGPDISRPDRLLLTKRGFLVEVIKGWYALTTPQAIGSRNIRPADDFAGRPVAHPVQSGSEDLLRCWHRLCFAAKDNYVLSNMSTLFCGV